MSNEKSTITVFGREDESADRALFDRINQMLFGTGEVATDKLKAQLNHFLTAMQEVINTVPAALGEFDLDTITITAEVSAKGQVSLLGTGGELSGQGGITFTLSRQPKKKA